MVYNVAAKLTFEKEIESKWALYKLFIPMCDNISGLLYKVILEHRTMQAL